MAFIQIIEMRTKRIDELQQLADEYFAASDGKRTVERAVVARDTDDPDRYFVMAFFASAEAATANSSLPETEAFASKQAPLLDGPPTFTNLEVVNDRS